MDDFLGEFCLIVLVQNTVPVRTSLLQQRQILLQ